MKITVLTRKFILIILCASIVIGSLQLPVVAGRYNPSIMLAYKIAKLFDMTIEEVFIFEEEE